MAAAIFALLGTLVGVLGAVIVELARGRKEDIRTRRNAVQEVCVDFTAAIARAVNIAIINQNPDTAQIDGMHQAHLEARICYERLRLTAASLEVQKAGRYVLRYAFGVIRQAEGRPPRDDEFEHGPMMLLQNWLMFLYAEVRKELGVSQAKNVYREPDEWLASIHIRSPKNNPKSSPLIHIQSARSRAATLALGRVYRSASTNT